MAKIKISDYIHTLKAIVADSNQEQLEKNFAGFLQLLKNHKQSKLIGEILDGLEKELNADAKIGVATVHYPQGQEPDKQQLAQIKTFLKERFDLHDIDFNLVADGPKTGLLTDIGDFRYDWSLDNQLERFKDKIKA
ncbi:F0F1 ATP synthase subunit delta [bacterium]|nr:F0F1 ATP synthase subunit delta [bacterium]MBQ6436460.1 F0F1 ATP synthase subunit delta [bacterium]